MRKVMVIDLPIPCDMLSWIDCYLVTGIDVEYGCVVGIGVWDVDQDGKVVDRAAEGDGQDAGEVG